VFCKVIILAPLLCLTLFASISGAQTKSHSQPPVAAQAPVVDDLVAARAATETFLRGLKIADLSEGKEMMFGVQWITGEADNGRDFYVRPTFTEADTLFEKLFDTDIPGVRGYKRLLEMKAVSEGNTPLLIRYLMIAYEDQGAKQWKVLATEDGTCVDLDACVVYWSMHLHDPMSSEQDALLTYGEVLVEAGRIKDARQALTAALSAGTTATYRGTMIDDGKNSGLHRMQIGALLSIIEKVSGGRATDAGQPSPKTPN